MLLFVLGFLLGLCFIAVTRFVIDIRSAHVDRKREAFDLAVREEVNRRALASGRYDGYQYADGPRNVHVVDDDDPFARD